MATWSAETKTVLAAFILAAFASIVSPLTVAYIATRNQQADWERQDRVAAILKAEDAKKAAIAKAVDVKLGEIHSLVNSNLTAALQGEYEAPRS